MVGIAEFQCWDIHYLFPGAFTTDTAGYEVGKSTCSCSWETNFCLFCTWRETGSGIKNQERVIKGATVQTSSELGGSFWR